MKRFFYILLFTGILVGVAVYFWPSALQTVHFPSFVARQIDQQLFSSSSIPAQTQSLSRSLGESWDAIRERIASGTKISNDLYQSTVDKTGGLAESVREGTISVLGGTSTLQRVQTDSLSVDICTSIKIGQSIIYLIQIPPSLPADYEIDWGDGSITKGEAASDRSGVSVSHSYKTSGIYQSTFKLPSSSGTAISQNKICVE